MAFSIMTCSITIKYVTLSIKKVNSKFHYAECHIFYKYVTHNTTTFSIMTCSIPIKYVKLSIMTLNLKGCYAEFHVFH